MSLNIRMKNDDNFIQHIGGEKVEAKTFKYGVHIPHYKGFSEDKRLTGMSLPKRVIIPLLQHLGATCEPLVSVGDLVEAGQKIGESQSFISAPVHASVSGRVVAVEPRAHCNGEKVNSIVIKPDAEQKEFTAIDRDLSQMSVEELLQCVKDAGIVGMGGAGFPTKVKMAPPPSKPIDTVIINGAECEPFLTADHRAMLEMQEDLIHGIKVLMKAVGAKTAFIGIENNKPDAIAELTKWTEKEPAIEIAALQTKYPQGGEKQLINAILGRTVPSRGLPMDVGVVVQNVGTTIAISRAIKTGMPLIERIVTVSGPKVPKSGNYIVKLGTPIGHILRECGVDDLNGSKLIMGGPMTGRTLYDLNVPVIKTTSGIVVLPPEMVKEFTAYSDCVNCGRCVEHCPMSLYPNKISIYSDAKMYGEVAKWDVIDCIECGICSYLCPADRPIVDMIKRVKPIIRNLESSK